MSNPSDAFEVYESKLPAPHEGDETGRKTEWRWRVTANNGEIVAAGSEGFYDRRGAIQNAQRVWRYLNAAMIAGKLSA